jgi:hypothetical protein
MKDNHNIPVHILRDNKLSLQAKGLLSILLFLSNEEDFDLKYLNRYSTNGIQSTDKAFKELKLSGYIEMVQNKSNGKFLKSTLKFHFEVKEEIPF